MIATFNLPIMYMPNQETETQQPQKIKSTHWFDGFDFQRRTSQGTCSKQSKERGWNKAPPNSQDWVNFPLQQCCDTSNIFHTDILELFEVHFTSQHLQISAAEQEMRGGLGPSPKVLVALNRLFQLVTKKWNSSFMKCCSTDHFF